MKRLMLALFFLIAPLKLLAAIQCSIDNSPTLDFGATDPFMAGPLNANTQIQWSCSRGIGVLESIPFKMCIYVAADNDGGILPRNLRPANPGPAIPFNVYTLLVGGTIIQPSTNAIEVQVDMSRAFQYSDSDTVNIFGIVPGPLPGNALAGENRASMVNSQVTRIGTNQSCNTTSGLPLTNYALNANLAIQNQCSITANDLNFGTQSSPLPQTDSDTFIDVRCTNTSPFTVGLSDGLNPSGGSRRMRDGSQFVSYGLFQDAARSIPWDSTTNRKGATGLGTSTSIMMSVFGRIPAAPSTPPGNYTDTITVDIEF